MPGFGDFSGGLEWAGPGQAWEGSVDKLIDGIGSVFWARTARRGDEGVFTRGEAEELVVPVQTWPPGGWPATSACCGWACAWPGSPWPRSPWTTPGSRSTLPGYTLAEREPTCTIAHFGRRWRTKGTLE